MNLKEIILKEMPFKDRIYLDRLLYYMGPMIAAKDYDEEKLSSEWRGIIDRWYEMSNHKVSLEQKIKEGYVLLDFLPLFREKLKKNKNTLDNIIRDGTHCFYATRADYFVSEDENTRKKAKIIYKTYGIRTRVVSESEFVRLFEVC